MIGRLLLHTGHGAAEHDGIGGGSLLYDIAPEHIAAVVAVIALVLAALLVRWRWARGDRWTLPAVEPFRRMAPMHRFVALLMLVSAAAHLGLALGHGEPGLRLLFLADAAALAFITYRLMHGRRWRLLATAVLVGSIGAYWVALVTGEAPDQVGMVTKLVELTALAIVLRPVSGRRLRAVLATGATVLLVILTDIAAWTGAFAVTGGGHHEPGAVAGPGTVLWALEDRPPTADEQAAAEVVYAATVRAIAPYADPAVAAAAGYQVEGMGGLDFHASNPAYEHDGRTFDPARPETLVYAMTPRGPVLLGAMFMMPGLNEHGPAVGGPLTVWHAHEQICFSLTPPAFTGILSPLGSCPFASLNLPITPQMIHVWTVPGAPDRFGDLDSEWRARYVASFGG